MAKLGALGYGAANLGNLHRELDDEQCWEICEAAWDSGIRYFDTAPHYGLGLSESRLGTFLRTKPRDEFTISTKVGRLLEPAPGVATSDPEGFLVAPGLERRWGFRADDVRRSLDESLGRLGLDRVDILYLHDPERFDLDLAEREAYPALRELQRDGVIGSAGVGSMSIEAIGRAAAVSGLRTHMVAGRLTLAEQPPAPILEALVSSESVVVAAGIYNSGVLASADPGADSRYEYGTASPQIIRHVRAIAAICRDFGVDLPTAAVHYPFRVQPVVSIVVGGSRPEQVRESVARLATPVPGELWDALTAAGLIR